MQGFLRNFQLFIARGNVLDLTVVVGAAFGGVTTLVDDVLTIGGADFQAHVLHLSDEVVIRYGAFLNTVVNFIYAPFAMFLVVRAVAAVQNLRRREAETGVTAEALPLLRSPS